jgi:NAD-reducing hydrogenase large subunit
MGLVTPENGLELYDGNLRLVDNTAKQLELYPASHYLDVISEHVENWSYLKFPYYKKMGYPQGVYRVGPLGRLNTIEKIDTPLAAEEFKFWKSINNGKPVENTLYYHLARLIEALFAVERVTMLLNDPVSPKAKGQMRLSVHPESGQRVLVPVDTKIHQLAHARGCKVRGSGTHHRTGR